MLPGCDSGQQSAADDARMGAEFRYDRIFQGHADIVDTGARGTYDFRRRRQQAVTEPGRSQKRNAAMRGYGPFIVGIGRKRKRRIGKCENRAAIGDAETVDHGRQHGHRDRGVPRLDQ